MYDNQFAERLSQLRMNKGVSARDMSLSLGQNPGYINNIESGKALPSMSVFFYICEYFAISPKDFFDMNNNSPELLNSVILDLKCLKPEQIDHLAAVIKDIKNNTK